MSNLAKDATLHHSGSHSVHPSHTSAEGISNEEVFLYFDATWRGKPVSVIMRADRYAASFYDPATDKREDKLTDWRSYAYEARYGSVMGKRGEHVTPTAYEALHDLCKPLAEAWLNSDAYVVSYKQAVARMIMKYFEDEYFGAKRIREALDKFVAVLPAETYSAISYAVSAHEAYIASKARAFRIIDKKGDE